MAILKSPENFDNTINYAGSLVFFCGISCLILMLKFGGFKASLNIFNGKRSSKEHNVVESGSTTGAYRVNREEFYGYGRLSEPPKKLTPAMVVLPPCEQVPAVRPAKSTNDLTLANNPRPHLSQSTPNVSSDPRGGDDVVTPSNSKQNRKDINQGKEQKRLEKQRLAEQKAREKKVAQEQAKQEKLRKEREKKEAKENNKKNKRKAPAPQLQPQVQQQLQPQMQQQPQLQQQVRPQQQPQPQQAKQSTPATTQYSTNTLESSISRSSGPPPYAEVPQPELVRNKNDASGNVSYSKPLDKGSWDLISQHRQQINRNTNTREAQRKQMVMDLNYNFNNNAKAYDDKDNSEV